MKLSWELSNSLLLASVLACFTASIAPPAQAQQQVDAQPSSSAELADQEDAAPFIDADSELEALKKRIATLEKAEQKRLDADAKKKADEALKAEEWIDTSTEKWTIRMGGHVQMDYVNWATAPAQIPAQDYFEFRRLRLLAEGTGYGVYDFRLQMTLEPESVGDNAPGIVTSPEVKDAYFSINEIPFIGRARIGNFFVPFSLEQVTNDTNNIFLERSIPTQGIFAADREVGMATYNCSDDQRLTWTSGIFLDSISESLKERIDDNQGMRLSERVTWLPYYDEASNGRYLVHTGMGVLHTIDQDGRVRFRARPQIREGPRLIDTGLPALQADSFTTGNLEFAVVWGRVTLQSEAFLSHVNMTATKDQAIGGAYVHVSYFLTGENRVYERFGQHGAQFARNAPYTNVFFNRNGVGLGAWELKGRWSNLNLRNLNAGEYNDLTLGVNWYWSDRVRVMFDWIHPITSSDTPFGATESNLLGARFDFNW
jgi:phosphate-selective porin OprO and OprP